MKDRRPVEELSIEELEEILRIRRREARLERLRRRENHSESLDPLKPEKASHATAVAPPRLDERFRDTGATAHYRSRPIGEPREEEEQADQSVWRRWLRWPRVAVQWDWLRDKSLLVVELGVLAALIIVLVSSLATLREINRTSSRAYVWPTPTPTPPIHVVLPGGHTPPDSPGGPAPAEIPAHLRSLVSDITPLPAPTRGPEQAVRIQIPAIGVDAPVAEGDGWETLKRGAGHHVGSANPGERGNCIISAHNDIFGEVFKDLPDLGLDSEILVHTATQVHRYVATQKRIIEPTEVSVLEPSSSPIVTLISCYPYGIDTYRIAVIGVLEP